MPPFKRLKSPHCSPDRVLLHGSVQCSAGKKNEFSGICGRKCWPIASTLCILSPRQIGLRKKLKTGKDFCCEKKAKRPTIFFVDMEIMRTLTSSLGKVCGPFGVLLCTASGLLASDLVLQKVPPTAPVSANSASGLGPQATFALINYSVANTRQARALYVSSGDDLKLANSMIDEQAKTSFGFSAEDKSPTAVIDLGKSLHGAASFRDLFGTCGQH